MLRLLFLSNRSFKNDDLEKFSDLMCVLYKHEFEIFVNSDLSGLMYLHINCNVLLTFAEMHSIVLNAMTFFRTSKNHFGLESLHFDKITYENYKLS